MANIGYVESVLGPLPAAHKGPLKSAFEHVIKDLAFGPFEDGARVTNLQAVWLTGTTSTTANQEVSVLHGLERTPSFAVPVLPLATVNSQAPVLTVTRAADGTRVYVSSASTNVTFALLVG